MQTVRPYRRKTVMQAAQWTGDNTEELFRIAAGAEQSAWLKQNWNRKENRLENFTLIIGDDEYSVGDWMIVHTHVDPPVLKRMNDADFHDTYEPIE